LPIISHFPKEERPPRLTPRQIYPMHKSLPFFFANSLLRRAPQVPIGLGNLCRTALLSPF